MNADGRGAIDLVRVSKRYTAGALTTHALREVTLGIRRGEFVSIMGPSGSGKSTLLHILGFLDVPSAGEYRFLGSTLSEYGGDHAAALRNKHMGFVFQAFNLLPRATVLNNVILPMLYSKIPRAQWRERAAEALERVGLMHRLQYEPSELSGGEKQRVAIARALVLKPTVIFADEPTGNLDSENGRRIMDIFSGLHAQAGQTVVVVTHDPRVSERTERTITMADGAIESDTGAYENK